MRTLFILFLLLSIRLSAQRVGINTTNPQQVLDVNGAIRIGNTSTSQPGSLRYNNGSFEGADSNGWQYLGLPSKAIILAQSVDTFSIKASGFSVLRQMDNWDTVVTTISTTYGGSWSAGFPLTANVITPAQTSSSDCAFFNNRLIYLGNDAFLYEYDISLERWNRLPNAFPLGARNAASLVIIGNDVFVFGGWVFQSGVGFTILNSGAKYNLLQGTWTTIANMPVSNCFQLALGIGTDIYFLNGASSFSSTFVYSRKMYRYNTQTNSWSGNLSVANTPSFLNQGQGVVWNGRIVYHSSGLQVASYNPVTHELALIRSGLPSESLQQGLHTLGTNNKLYIAGIITDSSNITSDPNIYMQQHFEVDLVSGAVVKLRVCGMVPGTVNLYQFHNGSGRVYSIGSGSRYNIFTRTGSQTCDVILRRRGYWYYMKKN